ISSWTSVAFPRTPWIIQITRVSWARPCSAASPRRVSSFAAAAWVFPSPRTSSGASARRSAPMSRPPGRAASRTTPMSSACRRPPSTRGRRSKSRRPGSAPGSRARSRTRGAWRRSPNSKRGCSAWRRNAGVRPPATRVPSQRRARPSRPDRPSHRGLRQVPRARPPRLPASEQADRQPREEPAAAEPAVRQDRRAPDALQSPLVEETLAFLESQDFLNRLWTKDATLWKGDPALVRNRLGWLTAPTIMRAHVEDLRTFADEIRRLEFSQVVVLGMGGSSLSTEVFSHTFGSKMGFPDLLMLDSTDPAAVKHTLDHVNLPRTLFLVSSKSGTTAETLALYAFFHERVEATMSPKPRMQFVAITDAGTPLDAMARETGFRHTFLNPASIGGRYSALSFFGLVPAGLIGVDLKTVLERARTMVERSGNTVSAQESPAARLGAALAGFARAGRDKVTLILSEKLRTLGAWLEQLLAESLGKDGKGLVPVVDEPLGNPVVYGADRLFVALTLEEDGTYDSALDALADAGHPVIRLRLKDPLDVVAEFFRWELATATAGAILGVNPFDEPDVARAKQNTASLLTQWKKSLRLPEWPADAEENGIVLMAKANPKPEIGRAHV